MDSVTSGIGLSDWIEDFMLATEAIPSPPQFRLWSSITTISAALERKTWSEGSARQIFPNLFTLLVGPPASGKTNSIWKARDLLRTIDKLYLAPDNVTKPKLIEKLAASMRTEIATDGSSLKAFCALTVCCSEFGVFFTHHDTEFLSVLNEIYEGPPSYIEERITADDRVVLKPNLTILAGTQPDFLGSFMPEEAWGMGFASRLIMVYAGECPVADMFAKNTNEEFMKLSPGLKRIFNLKGEFYWPESVRTEMHAWREAGCPPTPQHNKLRHYNGRRAIHVAKLTMISAASRAASLDITMDDFERAKGWLLAAEVHMPDIFNSMVQKSDEQVIDDLHTYIWQIFASVVRDNRKGIREEVIYAFLGKRLPSYQVEKVFEQAKRIGVFRQGKAPDEWLPRPRSEFVKE